MHRGVVEDLLVQIDKFYFLIDFIVLDTHLVLNASYQIFVILGRMFFTTSNALINCRSGVQIIFSKHDPKIKQFLIPISNLGMMMRSRKST